MLNTSLSYAEFESGLFPINGKKHSGLKYPTFFRLSVEIIRSQASCPTFPTDIAGYKHTII